MSNATKLAHLNVHGNQITELPNIPAPGIPENNVLQYLYLWYNIISTKLSPEVWAQFPALRLVDMIDCGITTWSNMTLASKLTHFFSAKQQNNGSTI